MLPYKKSLELFWIFFKIGLFTFGGGYAMIPQIKEVVIEKKKWISEEEMLDIIAIAESTPGPIAVNSATYIGYKVNKFFGSLCATLGVVLPSFIIICLVSLIIESFLANQIVAFAFMGIRSMVAILILNAVLKLAKSTPKNVFSLVIFLIALVLTFIFPNISTVYFLLAGFILGILWYVFINKPKKEEGAK
jgi:chromate transporter